MSPSFAQTPATSPNADADRQETAAQASVEVGQTSALNELAWMVGKWVDQGEDATITTDCSWTHGGKFLSRSFSVTTDGTVALEGTQLIGWGPIEAQIRSWTFDSAGGFGTGQWTRDGDHWLVKTSFVLASGERASAINVITYVDQDTLRWQSTNREVAGELQPNIPEVTVIRQQSKETESSKSNEDTNR
jgi:hypothetical protein